MERAGAQNDDLGWRLLLILFLLLLLLIQLLLAVLQLFSLRHLHEPHHRVVQPLPLVWLPIPLSRRALVVSALAVVVGVVLAACAARRQLEDLALVREVLALVEGVLELGGVVARGEAGPVKVEVRLITLEDG